MGSPRVTAPFRAFLEEDPFGTEPAEYEGHKDVRNHYRTPMRAALARLAGRGGEKDPFIFMAHCLYRVALRDGDWPYTETALHRLYERYHEEPPVSYYHSATEVA